MHNVVHSTTMYYVQLIVPRLLQIPKLGISMLHIFMELHLTLQ